MEKHKTTWFFRHQINILSLLLVMGLSTKTVFAQESVINLNLAKTTLGNAINEVKKQTGYQFFYEDSFAKISIPSVSVKDASIKVVLDKILQNTGITYKIKEKVIYLTKKEGATPEKSSNSKKMQGKVVGSKDEPLMGVTVQVEGGGKGTTTNENGGFSIDVKEGQTIRFSYLGYIKENIQIDEQTFLTVKMSENIREIGEVVVTALGIKREKKALGYAIQELDGSELTQAADPSIASTLQGKVAGVNITQAATGMAGSTKISIRGNSSLTGNNEPLWIIDGIPFSDNQEGANASLWSGYDRGGAAIDLNPEDVQSISVLKGPNAAALYGSRASNGVILVTTKRGTKNEGLGITYSGSYTTTDVAETLNMQKVYGQGNNGIYDANSEFSWGSALDGSDKVAWNGVTYPYSYQGNKLKDYFQTGISQNHNVSIGTATEKSNYRVGFGYQDNKGIFENEGLKKLDFDIKAGTEVNKILSLDTKIALSHTDATNRPQMGKAGELYQLYYLPNNIRLQDIQNYTSADKQHINWHGPTPEIKNPYYIRAQYPNEDQRSRAFGYFNLKLNLADWLKFSFKQAMDYSRTKIENMDRGSGIGINENNPETGDSYSLSEINFYETNSEFLFIGDRQMSEDLRLGFTAGANLMHSNWESLSGSIGNLYEKGFWSLGNVSNSQSLPSSSQGDREKKVNSVFGSVQFSYKSYLNLDLTARNDWSSALPKANRSYFYPSANLSFVATDFMHSMDATVPEWLSFAKWRASVAQVGNDIDAQSLYPYQSRTIKNGQVVMSYDNILPLGDQLMPEISTSYETGLEMKFLNDRLGFDFTAYYTPVKNQIMTIPHINPENPQLQQLFPYITVNSGEVINKGLELMINSTPVKTKNFRFDLDLNWAMNRNYVKKLNKNTQFLNYSGEDFMVNVKAFEGRNLGDIVAKRSFVRDSTGNLVIRDGVGLITSTKEKIIGNIAPNFTGSIRPTLTFKNLSITGLFDYKVGGDIVSVTEAIATQYGTAQRTANRTAPVVINGVDELGQPATFTYTAENYYKLIGGEKGIAEEFLYDASFLRLKELALSYTFGKNLLKKTPISAMRLSLVGRNLAYLIKHTPGSNPEASFDRSVFSQAIDYCSVPYSRTIGFSLNISL